MGWFGLGKKRSKFGDWIDERGISQREISRRTGIGERTLHDLANDDDRRPNWRTRKRLREAMREYDEEYSDDFWDD